MTSLENFENKNKSQLVENFVINPFCAEETNSVIVYHKGCSDGIMSVWIFLHFIKPKYIIPCKAGIMPDFTSIRKPHKDITLYFLDVCPTTLSGILDFKEVVICDHHLPGIEFFNSILKPDNFDLHLDIERSGCQIASDYITSKNKCFSENRFWMIDYVGDRDMHKFKLPFSREINLSFFKKSLHYQIETTFLNFRSPLELTSETFEKHKEIGMTLIEIQNSEIEIACKTAILRNINLKGKNYLVWITNFQLNPSEVGAKLARTPTRDGKLPDFSCICTYDLRNEIWRISVRGREDGPNLDAICREMGGGGHHDAAKFELSYRDYDKIFNRGK